jgi:hypothetical protein
MFHGAGQQSAGQDFAADRRGRHGPGCRHRSARLASRGLDIVAAESNTISPPHDAGGMSAYLAGQVAMMTLHLMALGRI